MGPAFGEKVLRLYGRRFNVCFDPQNSACIPSHQALELDSYSAKYEMDCPRCKKRGPVRAIRRHMRTNACNSLQRAALRALRAADTLLEEPSPSPSPPPLWRGHYTRRNRPTSLPPRVALPPKAPPPPSPSRKRKRKRKRGLQLQSRSPSPLPPPPRPESPQPESPPLDLPLPQLPRPQSPILGVLDFDRFDLTRYRHPDFQFDTPGAGPSNHAPINPPARLVKEIENFVRKELVCEEELTHEEEIAYNKEYEDDEELEARGVSYWRDGLTPLERLSQALKADIARTGGYNLTELDMLIIDAFNFKVDTDITGRAFRKMRRAFRRRMGDLPTEQAIATRIKQLSGTEAQRIDCCPKICVAYTGPYEDLRACPVCRTPRYKPHRQGRHKLVARRWFQYIPLIPRLSNLYRDPVTARLMRYRADRPSDPNVLSDIFDGKQYQQLQQRHVIVGSKTLKHRYFSSSTDVALGLSTDGFGPFRSRKQSCWPLLVFNYNLPKEIRHRLENLLCLGVIPGPFAPKELDSFLEPLIDELELLAWGVPAFDGENQRPFCLRAYLISCFGDMPAVAKLMRMKGHTGKSPCRACSIIGFPLRDEKGHTTYYPPLSCPVGEHRDGPRHYDPLNLPRRSHRQFLHQAVQVERAKSNREEDERGRESGISGLTALAAVSSLDFPTSFPHDLMHIMFENTLPNLLNLWTRRGKYKEFGTGQEGYIIQPKVWEAIGEACAASGDTIPAAFGCRVPNLDKNRHEVTSESMLLFATLLGPGVLRDRFTDKAYYRHFVELVRIIKSCISFQVSRDDIDMIRQACAKWVRRFEELYYNRDQTRIRACTLPLHAILHIADDIENMGPMWCYWAFPMERFCGALARANKSRRYPYSSLNRYLLQLAQLAQIKRIYGLADELNLEERRTNIVEGTSYPSHPTIVFTNPRRDIPINPKYKLKVAEYVSEIIGAECRVIREAIHGRRFVHWGKMQQIDEGDYGGGDLYHSIYDRWNWNSGRTRRIEGQRIAYGRIDQFIVIDADFLQTLSEHAENTPALLNPLVIAVVAPIPCYKHVPSSDLVQYRLASGNLASTEIIDARDIDCLVGRFTTGDVLKRMYIVDRTTVVGRLDMLDDAIDQE